MIDKIKKLISEIANEHGLSQSLRHRLKSKLAKGAAQRLAPFNPHKDVSDEEYDHAQGWVVKERPKVREELPRHEGAIRFRGLNKLAAATKSRVNDKGEREFLLHRGMDSEEHEHHKSGEVVSKTSWTPKFDEAYKFSLDYKDHGRDIPGRVVSAWVSEKDIHHFPYMMGADDKIKRYRAEFEVVVNPHKTNIAGAKTYPEIRNERRQMPLGEVPLSHALKEYGKDSVRQLIRQQIQKSRLAKGSARKLAPYNPKPGNSTSKEWVREVSNRENLPRHEGPVRFRAINRLFAQTQHRRNPNTGDLEFLLHRGMSVVEHGAHHAGKIDKKTSWSTRPDIAHNFAVDYSDDEYDQDGSVVSAWIPAKQMHHFAFMEGHDPDVREMRDEGEVIVNPHNIYDNIHAEGSHFDRREEVRYKEKGPLKSVFDQYKNSKKETRAEAVRRAAKNNMGMKKSGGWEVKIRGMEGYYPLKDIKDLGPERGNVYILHDGREFHQVKVQDMRPLPKRPK